MILPLLAAVVKEAQRRRGYAERVSPEAQEHVEKLRTLLEAELDDRLSPQWGCWPLSVGVAGMLLGLTLLAGLL